MSAAALESEGFGDLCICSSWMQNNFCKPKKNPQVNHFPHPALRLHPRCVLGLMGFVLARCFTEGVGRVLQAAMLSLSLSKLIGIKAGL